MLSPYIYIGILLMCGVPFAALIVRRIQLGLNHNEASLDKLDNFGIKVLGACAGIALIIILVGFIFNSNDALLFLLLFIPTLGPALLIVYVFGYILKKVFRK